MSVELSNQSIDAESARRALAEIRVAAAEVQTFFEGFFDRLEGLKDQLPVQEAVPGPARAEAGPATLDEQIERLAALAAEAAEIAKSVVRQKQDAHSQT